VYLALPVSWAACALRGELLFGRPTGETSEASSCKPPEKRYTTSQSTPNPRKR